MEINWNNLVKYKIKDRVTYKNMYDFTITCMSHTMQEEHMSISIKYTVWTWDKISGKYILTLFQQFNTVSNDFEIRNSNLTYCKRISSTLQWWERNNLVYGKLFTYPFPWLLWEPAPFLPGESVIQKCQSSFTIRIQIRFTPCGYD